MAAKGDKRIASATFFAAQQDFSEAGDLLLFTNEDWLKDLEEQDGRGRRRAAPARPWPTPSTRCAPTT